MKRFFKCHSVELGAKFCNVSLVNIQVSIPIFNKLSSK